MEQLKELVPGETVIGTVEGKYDGIYRKFTIMYGNVADPVINDKVLHLSESAYIDMLTKFLQSKEGQAYKSPTGKEAKAAVKDLINKETEIQQAKNAKELEEKQAKELEDSIKREASEKEAREIKMREIATTEESNRLAKISIANFEKKIKTQTILNIVLVVINLALIAYVAYTMFWR